MSSRNRTLQLTRDDRRYLPPQLLTLDHPLPLGEVENRVIHQDALAAIAHLPARCVDLLIADPPYNLSKTFNATRFTRCSLEEYANWFEAWLLPAARLLKPDGALYICGDWYSSASIFPVLAKYFRVRNRITWEREKGRGAKANWKNTSEDIWFATVGARYHFNPEAVKLKRKVVAPYRAGGHPKDWQQESDGGFRLTGASNFWSDITVPFWSMPENTPHPTQKPEKLFAKLILASTRPGDLVFDPFLGSGTTAVVCRKLDRRFIGIELDLDYALFALKRLGLAATQPGIQGYHDGIFWERNAGKG